MKEFIRQVDQKLASRNLRIDTASVTDDWLRRDITPCMHYQVGICSEPGPIHHIHTGNQLYYYTHVCDFCGRVRNSFPEHPAGRCEVLAEIDKKLQDPNYNTKFLMTGVYQPRGQR